MDTLLLGHPSYFQPPLIVFPLLDVPNYVFHNKFIIPQGGIYSTILNNFLLILLSKCIIEFSVAHYCLIELLDTCSRVRFREGDFGYKCMFSQ